jgi:hypothetical protein
VLVFSKGGQLLIAQVIAGLTFTVGGYALGGGTLTVPPWLFLNQYFEVPPLLRSDSSFATVLLSHKTLALSAQRGSTPAPAPVCHGGPPSCPDPVGVNAALSACPATSLHFGGVAFTMANARSMSILPWLHAGGTFPLIMGGSSIPPPPPTLDTTIMATTALLRIMRGIRLSNFLLWCMWGIKLILGMYPCLCTVVHPFPRAIGALCSYIGCPKPGVCKLIASPFFVTGRSPFLLWV